MRMSGGKGSGPGKDARDITDWATSTLSSLVGPALGMEPGTQWVLKNIPETWVLKKVLIWGP